MKLFSIQKSLSFIAFFLVITKSQGAVVPLSPANPDPVFRYSTNFDWSSSLQPVNQTFSVDVDEPARVHITDLNHQGKGFSVYDNDQFLGETATVITRENPYGIDEINYRQGFFNLEKGRHIITVQLNDPAEKGTGTIRMIPGWNKETTVIVPTTAVNSTTALNNTATAVTETAPDTSNDGNTENQLIQIESQLDENQEGNVDNEDCDHDKESDDAKINSEAGLTNTTVNTDVSNDIPIETQISEAVNQQEGDIGAEANVENENCNEEDQQSEDIEAEYSENIPENDVAVPQNSTQVEETGSNSNYMEYQVADGENTEENSNEASNNGTPIIDNDDAGCEQHDEETAILTAKPANSTPYTVTLTSTIIVNVYRTETGDTETATPTL